MYDIYIIHVHVNDFEVTFSHLIHVHIRTLYARHVAGIYELHEVTFESLLFTTGDVFLYMNMYMYMKVKKELPLEWVSY